MAMNNNFKLTLDTLAPAGSITTPKEYTNAQVTLSINKGDATFMKVWVDSKSVGLETDAPADWEAAATSKVTNIVTDGVYYAHLILMDDVANKSQVYNSTRIVFQKTAPTVSNVSINDGAAITNNRDVKLTFKFTTNTAGTVSYSVTGDLVSPITDMTLTQTQVDAGAVEVNVKLSGTDPEHVTKTLTVTVKDRAGNVSSPVSDTIILDTEFLSGSIVLRDGADKKTINDQWVNVQEFIVKLDLVDSVAADVVAYKLWGDFATTANGSATTEPAEWTTVTKGTDPIVIDNLYLTSATGEKTIYAQVKDEAGNVTTLGNAKVSLDMTSITVSISSNKDYVSNVAPFNAFDLTPTITPEPTSGISNYTWYKNVDGTVVTHSSGEGTPGTITINSSDLGKGGAKAEKKFRLSITTGAGTTITSEELSVYFDTVAPAVPAGTITMNSWYNASNFTSAGATASATDSGAGLHTMQCWVSSTAADDNAKGDILNYKANPTHTDIKWDGVVEGAGNYLHIKYTDNVGNFAIGHSNAFGVDTVAPSDGAIKFSETAYHTTTASVTLTYSDGNSGVAEVLLWGDIAVEAGSATAITKESAIWQTVIQTVPTEKTEKTVYLTTGDGIKTIYAQFKDTAGNISANVVSDTTELDTVTPSASLVLVNNDDAKIKDNPSNVALFAARVTYTNDTSENSVQFKLYGDFTENAQSAQGITEDATEWKDLVKSTGKDYQLVTGLYCTTGAGTKTIYLKVKDNAGNVSEAASATFYYDTTAPEVTVSDIDYNRISKVHAERRNADGLITGKYADETKFSFTPSVAIQAYKVCAYLDKTDAKLDYPATEDQTQINAWVANQVAIPQTGDTIPGLTPASVNMHATGLNSSTKVDCLIKGADYEYALKQRPGAPEDSVDGAHYIVVYVENLAGNWSVAAAFTAE